MLPDAVIAGIDARAYWDYTLGEIQAMIQAYSDRERRMLRNQAAVGYCVASITGASVGRYINSKNQFPTAREAFPGLFDDDSAQQADWGIMRNRMADYIAAKRGIGRHDS